MPSKVEDRLKGLTVEQLEGLLRMVEGGGSRGGRGKKPIPTTQHVIHHRSCDVCGAHKCFTYTAQILGEVDEVQENVCGCDECRTRLTQMDTPALVEVVMELLERLKPTSSIYVAQGRKRR